MNLAHLEPPTTLHPDIYVAPKDRDPASEDDRQAVFVAYMRRCAKQCRVYAVPNGGKRTPWAAAKARREGMASGEPDLAVALPDGRTLRLEFKAGSTNPSANQIDALNWYHAHGHPVAVVRTSEQAVVWLREQGAPVPAMTPAR